MKERLSITINKGLYEEVKKAARERNESVSHIVEKALKGWKRDEIREDLKEYYRGEKTGERKDILREGETLIGEVWEDGGED